MRLKVVQEARVESVLISYMLHLSIVYSESSCTTISRQIFETRLYASKETAIGRLVVLRKHLPPQRLNIALETGCTWRWDRLTLGLPVSRAEHCPAKLSCLRLRCAEPFTCTFEARKPCGFVLKSAAKCITAGREQKVCAALRASPRNCSQRRNLLGPIPKSVRHEVVGAPAFMLSTRAKSNFYPSFHGIVGL
jgi:hypothetical protein